MLDQESKELYKSIHLTKDLRGVILARQAKKPDFFSFVSSKAFLRPAAAVCSLALIVTLFITLLMPVEPGIYLGNTRLSGESTIASVQTVSFLDGTMRLAANPEETDAPFRTAGCAVPLTLSFGENVYLAVQDGILLLEGENGTNLFAGGAGEVKNGKTAFWVVDRCETDTPLTAQIYDLTGKLLARMTLTYDATDSIWLITTNSSEK